MCKRLIDGHGLLKSDALHLALVDALSACEIDEAEGTYTHFVLVLGSQLELENAV